MARHMLELGLHPPFENFLIWVPLGSVLVFNSKKFVFFKRCFVRLRVLASSLVSPLSYLFDFALFG